MNVFLVLSPLQLLNALEAKAHFGTQDNILVVLRHTTQGYPISMFKRVVNEADWKEVHYFSTYEEERVARLKKYHWVYLSWLQQRRLTRFAKTLGRVDGLFAGSYLEFTVRHFCNALPHKTLYVLDSGTDTFLVNKARGKTSFEATPSWRTWLVNRLIGTRDHQAERVTFFTVYGALDVRAGDQLVQNHYHTFRERISVTTAGNEVWFLGEPLVINGYFGEAVYLDYLERIRRFYADKHFVYLPHSREQEADVQRISERLGCEVRRYGLPVELALSRADPRPSEVASLICTALTNIHVMFGPAVQITSVYVEPEHLQMGHAYFADIYGQFRREEDSAFRVLSVKELTGSEEASALDKMQSDRANV